jgi:hypothetical protein
LKKFKFDTNAFEKSIAKSKFLETKMYKVAEKRFSAAKDKFSEEFNNHPVTIEIDSGPNASNISSTLGGFGNLFSFIGFNSGSSPTTTIKRSIASLRLLPRQAYLKITKSSVVSGWEISVSEIKNIGQRTKMPWESGRSWLVGIENGISGFSNYIYKKFISNSRSGSGIQSQSSERGGSFRPVPYFFDMYSKFLKRIGMDK